RRRGWTRPRTGRSARSDHLHAAPARPPPRGTADPSSAEEGCGAGRRAAGPCTDSRVRRPSPQSPRLSLWTDGAVEERSTALGAVSGSRGSAELARGPLDHGEPFLAGLERGLRLGDLLRIAAGDGLVVGLLVRGDRGVELRGGPLH